MSYIGAIRLQAIEEAQEDRSLAGEIASASRIEAYA